MKSLPPLPFDYLAEWLDAPELWATLWWAVKWFGQVTVIAGAFCLLWAIAVVCWHWRAMTKTD